MLTSGVASPKSLFGGIYHSFYVQFEHRGEYLRYRACTGRLLNLIAINFGGSSSVIPASPESLFRARKEGAPKQVRGTTTAD